MTIKNTTQKVSKQYCDNYDEIKWSKKDKCLIFPEYGKPVIQVAIEDMNGNIIKILKDK